MNGDPLNHPNLFQKLMKKMVAARKTAAYNNNKKYWAWLLGIKNGCMYRRKSHGIITKLFLQYREEPLVALMYFKGVNVCQRRQCWLQIKSGYYIYLRERMSVREDIAGCRSRLKEFGGHKTFIFADAETVLNRKIPGIVLVKGCEGEQLLRADGVSSCHQPYLLGNKQCSASKCLHKASGRTHS